MPDIQALRQRGVGFPLQLFDLTQGLWFTLLAFAGDGDSHGLQSIVAKLSADLPGKVVGVLRPDSAKPDPTDITVMRAETEALQAVFGGAPLAARRLCLLPRSNGVRAAARFPGDDA